MKKIAFFLSLLLLLTACQATAPTPIPTYPPTPLPTATATIFLTQTATNTATATATPTDTPEPVWFPEYVATLIDTKEITVRDVLPDVKDEFSNTKLFNLELITDETFLCETGQGESYRFVGYNSFNNYEGEAGYHSGEAYQAVAKVIMWAFFKSAVRAGYVSQQDLSTENQYAAFTQFIREMTEGKQVEIQAILPVATQEFKLQTKTLGLPETIRVIFVNSDNYMFKNLPRDDIGYNAWGMSIAPEGNLLELYIGGDKDLYYVHSYNLSRRYAFATWQAFGLNWKQASAYLVSKGNQSTCTSCLTGALDCRP